MAAGEGGPRRGRAHGEKVPAVPPVTTPWWQLAASPGATHACDHPQVPAAAQRMSWLTKLHPRAGGHRAPRSATLQSPVTADPETCLMVFKNHWAQVLRVLERSGASGGASGGAGGCRPAPDDLSAVRNNTYQMFNLLAQDRPPRGAPEGTSRGPILDFVAAENLLERLLCWHLQGDFGEERKVEQLKLYEMLLSQAHQPLLCHRPVLSPLLRLLSLCSEPTSASLENSLVLLLNQLCVNVAKEPSILELFFHSQADQGPANLIIFSLLIPFIHHEGVLGQQARDALLLIMAMSASNQAVAKSITDNSYFCPVLATGLSALYSSLPRKLEARGDDWHCLRREDWLGVSSLVLFMNSLDFCNAVIQVAHPLVQKQLVDYVHNGFLVPVMGPALHKTSPEELVASTAYLELFLRSVSEPALLKTFLRFLLLHRHDGATILDTLVTRIAGSSRLCMVSLGLFRTLLSLNCEDVMLQLVLRYLLPCSHLMLSQRRAVRDLDIYGRAAAKFLSLTPRCCHPRGHPPVPPPERRDQQAAWHKGPGSPTVDPSSSSSSTSSSSSSSAMPAAAKPSTPSRLSFFSRQPSAAHDATTTTPRSPATPSGSPWHRGVGSSGHWEESSWELEGNYLEYLRDARRSVERCAWACRVWSAPYDGDQPTPPAASLPANPSASPPVDAPHPPAPPTPRTKKRGLPEGGPCQGYSEVKAELPPEAVPNGVVPSVGWQEEEEEEEEEEEDVVVKKVRRCPRGGEGEKEEEERRDGTPRGAVPAQKGAAAPEGKAGWEAMPSVDSLLEEMLAQAPGDANGGAGVTIEAFTQELKEIEAELKNGASPTGLGCEVPAAAQLQELPEHHPLSREEEEAFASFSTLPDGEALARAAPKAQDPLAQLVASPPRALGAPPSQPFTGPFVAVLFGKLENMPHNSLYVNCLLTGLLAQLASYPQPLLRSFLLNTNMVFQPSVKSLLQVLGSVKAKLETFAASQEDFPGLLLRARRFLVARGRLEGAEGPSAGGSLRRDTPGRSRKPSLGELLLRHANSPTRARHAAQLALQHARGASGSAPPPPAGPATPPGPPGEEGSGGGAEAPGAPPRVKNAVYCAVIFSEFLKELAAIAQAHAVTPPFLTEPPEE
ncbi:LOW QUALITY PROTEIN: FHF complex subunit HOOK-interacting protein 1B [Pogoniulus pusillus]|uniref:LOW QUALITY PROTEIN: FHF complex subunit HOOK-interacting protein 1B n=1 Tax=Pogoniulus pusillus TaxID=488313 RepID=UPI0030B97C8D